MRQDVCGSPVQESRIGLEMPGDIYGTGEERTNMNSLDTERGRKAPDKWIFDLWVQLKEYIFILAS